MALVLNTNCGFCSAAPSTDPEGTGVAVDNYSIAIRDDTPAGVTTITEIGWYCSSNPDQGQNFEVAIYTDDTDMPGTIVDSDVTNTVTNGAGWKVVTGLNFTVSASTTYWIAVGIGDTTVSTLYDYKTEVGKKYAYDSAEPSLLDPWEGTSSVAGINAIYAVYSGGAGNVMKVNIGDDNKTVTALKLNDGDSWKTVNATKLNDGDSWKTGL